MQVIAGSIMASVLDFLFPTDLFVSALARLLWGFSLWSCAVTEELLVTSCRRCGMGVTLEQKTYQKGWLAQC